jgi:hypothetical protein
MYIEPETLEGTGISHEELLNEKEHMPLEWRYPADEDHGHMNEKVEELKKMIKQKVPHIDMEHYNLLDHMAGRCDYDPYDRYDAEWHDEAIDFGHMYSESVPSSYQDGEVTLPMPEEEQGEDDENYEEVD